MAMRMVHSPRLERLGSDFQDARSLGVVRVHLAEHRDALGLELVDAFAEACGYVPCGVHWHPSTQEQAVRLLAATLTRDLAYGECVMNEEDCQRLLDAFFSLFPAEEDALRCFATCQWDETKGARSAFRGMTGATFDAVVVAVSCHHIGAIVIEDED